MAATSPSRSVPVWSGPVAVLAVLTSVLGLADPRTYGQETQNWATQAQGQDIGNLVAAVVLVVAALAYRRGSARAGLVWLGTLLYFVYAFVVYALAVHFNALFLTYVAVLGLSAWAVILHVGPLRREPLEFPAGGRRMAAAVVLAATGLMFAALWLGELVPAVVTGQVPASLLEAGLWVNPIHVIDLSMVLPGFLATGVAALRGRPFGLFWLAPWLVFSVLMGASIVAAMVLMLVQGVGSAVPPAVMVSVVVVASLVVVIGYLARTSEPGRTGSRRTA